MARLEERSGSELRQTDSRIILELDQLATRQQLTLEKAGLPAFFVTNKADDLRFQMYILDFVDRIARKIRPTAAPP